MRLATALPAGTHTLMCALTAIEACRLVALSPLGKACNLEYYQCLSQSRCTLGRCIPLPHQPFARLTAGLSQTAALRLQLCTTEAAPGSTSVMPVQASICHLSTAACTCADLAAAPPHHSAVLQASYDPNAVGAVLAQFPYHVDSLLAMNELYRSMGEAQVSHDAESDATNANIAGTHTLPGTNLPASWAHGG